MVKETLEMLVTAVPDPQVRLMVDQKQQHVRQLRMNHALRLAMGFPSEERTQAGATAVKVRMSDYLRSCGGCYLIA